MIWVIFYADTVSLYVPFTSGVLLLVQNREIQAVHTASELGEFFGYNPELDWSEQVFIQSLITFFTPISPGFISQWKL